MSPEAHHNPKHGTPVEVERVQTGVRMEKRLLKVLKAVAEQKDMTLGDLLEGIVLHAFEGKAPFSSESLKEIEQFRKLYGLTLQATDSHRLHESQRKAGGRR
jgi:predicted DNA-binding ribbon-helix-helix protein